MVKPVYIGLVFVHNFAYYRNVLRGIRRYAEARPDWLFTSIAPEQLSARAAPDPRPNGLIASVATRRLVRSLTSWRRPVVNVSSVFTGLPFPRTGVDDARVGEMAAAHFLERGLRNFGFVGSRDYLLSVERGAAFCEAVRAAGHNAAHYEARMHLGYDPRGQRWDLEPSGQKWLQSLPKPVGEGARDPGRLHRLPSTGRRLSPGTGHHADGIPPASPHAREQGWGRFARTVTAL